MKTPIPTSKPKVLIQRENHLYCERCGYAWEIDKEQETHSHDCPWYEPVVDPLIQETQVHVADAFRAPSMVPVRLRKVNEALAQSVPVMPVVSSGLNGWVCSRCQRVFAPHVDECPHCQPGACGASRLDGEV